MPSTVPFLISTFLFLDPAAFGPWQADIERFEPAIVAFEELDKAQQDPDDAILFVGSSSIRLWETIGEDMAPYPVIQRGYGGAKFSDLAYFAERIISPHEFRAVVIFVANDVSGSKTDKLPAETVVFFSHVLEVVRAKQADVPMFLIGITPTASRWDVWDQIQATNAALKQAVEAHPQGHFITTAPAFLDDDGQPRTELFIADKLHLNRDGYKVWASLIQAELNRVLEATPAPAP